MVPHNTGVGQNSQAVIDHHADKSVFTLCLFQFTVARDTHELGVRLALGGGRRDLVLVVLRKGFRLVAIGTVIGVALALLVAPGLEMFLSGVSPSDPLTYGAVVACFGLVSVFASWLPARRALRIEAIEALRGT